MALAKFNISDESYHNGRCSGPKLKKRYIVAAIFLFLIIIGLIVYFSWPHNQKRVGLVPPNPEIPLPPSASKLRVFNKGAVCTDAVPCSVIGRDILMKNGSAVDATIAALFCNGVVNMHSMGIGGGFLMTIYTRATKEAISLIARETAPMKATVDLYKNDDMPKSGILAVGVPGELRGYWAAHQRFGVLSWKELIEPTITLCENGYNMTVSQYHALYTRKDFYLKDPLLNKWFYDNETQNYKKGGIIRPLELCNTLRIIAESGGDDLYNGTLAELLLNDIKEMGGIIEKEDLENYKVKWTEPIKATLQNQDTLYSVPPPGSGILLGFILKILDGYQFSTKSISTIDNTILTYHRIIEAFKFAFARRTELGDMDFMNNTLEIIETLTSTEYSNQIRNKIDDTKTYNDPAHYGAVFYDQGNHGTAHISVLAPNGDAVSVTSSVNLYFGAGITSPSTGIILNSVMDDFSNPAFTNYFGLMGSPANSIEPGKRPLSSKCPSVLIDSKGDVKMVIGASGGTKITTSIALVIMRTLWFGMNVKEAVDAPRLHHQVFPMEMAYEYGVLQQIITGLEKFGHITKRFTDPGSIICALIKHANHIYGNADFRKGGDVFGID